MSTQQTRGAMANPSLETAFIENQVIDLTISQYPRLYITRNSTAPADETIQYAIADNNGYIVTDTGQTTFPASSTTLIIYIADFIRQQFQLKELPPGFYFVLVKNVTNNQGWALPVIVASSTFTSPFYGDPNLQYYTVFDKYYGLYTHITSKAISLPADSRYEIYAYFKKGKYGRLVKIDNLGRILLDTGYHHHVILSLELNFNSLTDFATHMFTHSYGLTPKIAQQTLQAILTGDPIEAITLLRPFYMYTWIGTVLDYDFIVDTVNNIYKIIVRSAIYLGEFDWWKVLKIGAIGCVAGVAGAVVATVASAGALSFTLPLAFGACSAGAIAGLGVGVIAGVDMSPSTPPQTIINYTNIIEQKGNEGKKKNENYYNDAASLLQQWLQQGKITQDDYNQMMSILNNWKTTINQTIDDIVSTAKTAIEAGYEAGKEEGRKEATMWIALAGVGGFALGVIVGKH